MGKLEGKPWENQVEIDRKSWENPWENHRKIMGIFDNREIHGLNHDFFSARCFTWENMDKAMIHGDFLDMIFGCLWNIP